MVPDVRYQFEIKDSGDSAKHQAHFFNLGYEWPTEDGKSTHTCLVTKYNRFLYLDPNKKIITRGDTDWSRINYIPCKLLQPKQKEFLEYVISTDHQYSEILVINLKSMIKKGFYKIILSELLNDLIQKHKNNISDKVSYHKKL